MSTNKVYAIYWIPSGSTACGGSPCTVSANLTSLVNGYLGNVASDNSKTSNVFGVTSQYGVAYNATFAGASVDTDAFPGSGCDGGGSTCLTEEQIFSELHAFLPTQGWTGDAGVGPAHPTKVFAVFLPKGVVDCFDSSSFDGCSANSPNGAYYCAYHTAWTDGVSTFVWANMPYSWNIDGCSSGVSPNNDLDSDTAIGVLSHEYIESLTDPYGSAWFDSSGYEIADKCQLEYGSTLGTFGGTAYNQGIGSGFYYTQLEYSNHLHNCFQVGPPTVSGLSPTSGVAGDSIGITGTNFFGSVTVLFNGVPSPSVTVDSPTHITAVVPAGNFTGHITVQAVGGNVTSTQVFGQMPTITGLSVASGFAGQMITVNGTGFRGVTAVKFNGVAASFSGVATDGTSLHAIVPTSATTGPISVTTGGVTGTSSTNFVVLPHVTSFTPLSGVAGSSVTVGGTGFSGTPVVDFTGSAGAFVVSHSATSVVVQVPVDAAAGVLTVHTADGDSASVAVFKPLPKITHFDQASYLVGDTVTVSGSNFTANGALTAKLGTLAVAAGSVSATSFQFVVPDGGLTSSVSGTNLDGTATSPATLKVRPTIAGDPAPNEAAAGAHVIISGKTFTGTTSVKFNGTVLAPFTIGIGGTSLNVTVPAAAIDGPISITNAGGTTNTASNFLVDGKVTSFSPLAATGGSNVSINGTGFGAAPVVHFTGSAGAAVLVSHTATLIVAQVPADAHNGPITVTSAHGDSASVAVFKPLPKITGFGAANYQAGDTVTVNGTDFLATGLNPTVKLGLFVVVPSVVTDTMVQLTIPDNGLTSSVSATNTNGTATSPSTLKVRPTISGDPAPNDGIAGAHIVLTGKTFTGTTAVKFGDNTEAASFTIGIGGTSLGVTMPTAATTGKIGVTNAGGTTQTTNSFTVHPHINSFTPTSGPVGTAIVVNGSGFAGADAVNFGGGVSAVPTGITATSLHIVAPPGATTGPLTVHTASGGTSATSVTPFTVTFSVTSISPTAGNYNDDVVVNGVGLTGVTAVNFNGVAGTIQPGGTATQLHVHAPASGAITGHVTVWKSTLSVQAPQDFNLFFVGTINPSQGTRGAPVVISGHDFTGAAHVRFNGTDASFIVDSDTQITAAVPPGATSGNISVTIPAGTATSSGSFTLEQVSINEFQTAGTTSQDEFVELANTGPDSVDISGCSLVYRTAAGTSDTLLATVPASTPLLTGHFYVFGGSAFTGVADISFSTDLNATGGGLALRCYTNEGIVDSVGYGSATNAYVETAAAPAPPTSESAGRKPDGTDTGKSSADFAIIASPTPGATNGP